MITLFVTYDGKEVYDEDRIWVIRRPITYGKIEELHVFKTAYNWYKDKGYIFFADYENAEIYLNNLKSNRVITFAPTPIPVIVEENKEAYLLYVESGGMGENDLWTCVICDGGIIRHYRTDQVRVHQNATYGITKKDN